MSMDCAYQVECTMQASMIQQGTSPQEMQQNLSALVSQMMPGQTQPQMPAMPQGMPMAPPGMPSPYPPGMYPPCDPAQLRWIEQLQAQIMREEDKNRQAALRANAFSEAKSCSGKTLVDDTRGNVHCILDLEIIKVQHIMPDILHKTKGYYEITFSNKAKVEVGEDDFYKAGRLLDRISAGTGRKVRLLTTKYRTTELLRETILSMCEEVVYPFNFGWINGEQWGFLLVDKSTHSTRTMQLSGPALHKKLKAPETATEEVVAAEQIIRLFETMGSPELATTVLLWFHTAVLTTLLNALGYRLRMGLCFYSADPQVFAYLEGIFCWFSDPMIELSVSKIRLMDLMTERKDEPAVYHDGIITKGNAEVLQRAMTTGEIPLEISNGFGCPPMNSLPTVFSSSVSKLSHSANFATIDVSMDDIRIVSNSVLKGLTRHIPDYLMSFCNYVSQNIEKLEQCLIDATDEAAANADGLNREGMEVLTVMLGVKKIVASFYEYLALPDNLKDRAGRLLYSGELSELREALACCAGVGGDTEDLAMYFVEMVDEMIKKGCFDYRQISAPNALDPCEEGKEGIVYADEEMISFTQKAFRAVCKACGVGRPTMVNALKEASLVQGKPVNQKCPKTRITIGVRPATERVSVYQFDRESLNQ